MEVILLERVEKLGVIGDVVKVKDGFARNYLLPNKKALRSNAANKKVFEANRERLVQENANRRADAEKESKGLEGVSVTLIRQASNTGQLYGSVAVRDIVEALVAAGVDRDFLTDAERVHELARTMSGPGRTVSAQRDEEHNGFELNVEDRTNGYSRQAAFGFDFVTAAEYRTLLATRRDLPAVTGDFVVSSTAESLEDTGEEGESPEGAPAVPAPAGTPAPARRAVWPRSPRLELYSRL